MFSVYLLLISSMDQIITKPTSPNHCTNHLYMTYNVSGGEGVPTILGKLFLKFFSGFLTINNWKWYCNIQNVIHYLKFNKFYYYITKYYWSKNIFTRNYVFQMDILKGQNKQLLSINKLKKKFNGLKYFSVLKFPPWCWHKASSVSKNSCIILTKI